MSVLDGFCIGGTGALDELRCDECVWGRETNDLFSGGVALDDGIVGGWPAPEPDKLAAWQQ